MTLLRRKRPLLRKRLALFETAPYWISQCYAHEEYEVQNECRINIAVILTTQYFPHAISILLTDNVSCQYIISFEWFEIPFSSFSLRLVISTDIMLVC